MADIDPRFLLFWGFALCWLLAAVSVELLKYAKLNKSKALLGLQLTPSLFWAGRDLRLSAVLATSLGCRSAVMLIA